MATDLIINEDEGELHVVTDRSDLKAERFRIAQHAEGCELYAQCQNVEIFLGRLKPEMFVAWDRINKGRLSVIDNVSCTDTRVLEITII